MSHESGKQRKDIRAEQRRDIFAAFDRYSHDVESAAAARAEENRRQAVMRRILARMVQGSVTRALDRWMEAVEEDKAAGCRGAQGRAGGGARVSTGGGGAEEGSDTQDTGAYGAAKCVTGVSQMDGSHGRVQGGTGRGGAEAGGDAQYTCANAAAKCVAGA